MGNNLVSATGEYYVCAQLCQRGYLALLTPKNNPLYDVVVTNSGGTRSLPIQVKTKSVGNARGWKLGADICKARNNPDLFIVLVELLEAGSPNYFVYEYDKLGQTIKKKTDAYLSTPKKDGNAKKDPGFRWHDFSDFGLDDNSRKNNWKPIIDRLEEKPKQCAEVNVVTKGRKEIEGGFNGGE